MGPAAALAEAAGTAWLSAAEQARLRAITAPGRRAQFLAGRWVARSLLAALHGGDPLRDWALTADPHGPPRLLRPAADRPVHLAISHSGDHVACAVDDAPVGIDLECPHPRDIEALAASVCTQAERAELLALDPARRLQRFHVAWTLKEAWIKRRGEALSIARLAMLDTRAAAPRGSPDAWTWQHAGALLALAARSLPLRRHGDACALAHPQAWRVRETVTSP